MISTSEKQIDFHFFICTHSRDEGASCAPQGALAIQQALKEWSKSEEVRLHLKGRKIRINRSGCLDRCKEGVACVAYPQGKWILSAKENDIPDLKAQILKMLDE